MKQILITIFRNRPLAVVVIGFMLTIATFIGNIFLTYEITSNLRLNVGKIDRIYEQLDLLSELKGDVGAAESTLKNFLISGQTIYVRSHNRAVERLDSHLNRLFEQDRAIKISPKLMSALRQAVKEKEDLFSGTKVLALSKNKTETDRAQELFSEGAGKAFLIREILSDMESELRVSLQISRKYVERSISFGGYSNYLAIGIALLVAFFAIISITQDYLRQKEIELILRQMNDDKTRLFSILGHDLRSPLSSMNGVIYLMKNHYASLSESEIRDSILMLEQAAQNYGSLLEDLLTWSRLQLNKIQTNPQPCDIRILSRESIELFAERLIEKKIHLENAIPEGLMLNSDKPMLQTVLRNLLSNAIKFTRPGGRIDLGYREEKDWDIIVVADTGTGMSPAIIKTLFTNATVSMAGTQNEAGTGLGLSICKEFLAKAGGFLTVSSEEGKGSVISVLLPKEGKPNGKMPPNFS